MTETSTRATGATVASKAKAMAVPADPKTVNSAKRKREALGEVTSLVTNNRSRPLAGRGKTKEKADGAVPNKAKALAPRQPLRTVATTRQTTSKGTVTGRAEVHQERDENAMAVDPPVPSLAVRRSLVNGAGTKAEIKRRTTSTLGLPAKQEKDEDEANRVCKKVRTSSEAPEEAPPAVDAALLHAKEEEAASRIAAQLEADVEEPEADPDGDDWDDLDADDMDDPLMVSEYVNEIFNYMKKLEVRQCGFISLPPWPE